jgi:ribokinase
MSKHVLSVGDLVLDIILPLTLPVNANEHQHPALRRLEAGGAGNFIIAARHMGLDVSVAGAVGDDPFGEHIINTLQEKGVNTDNVIAAPGSTSTMVIVLTDQESGEHVFIGHYGEGLQVPYPPALDEKVPQVDAVFIQGYSVAEERVVPLTLRAIERARAVGVPIYLDVGPFMAQVSAEHRTWLVESSAVLMMTEDELPLVAGEREDEAAYDYLLERGPQIVVVKRGAAGCTVASADEKLDVPGFSVPVVDTVGAGDCFDAAFMAGHLNGLSLHDCALLANAMGAASVQQVGAGSSAPTCDEVRAVLTQNGVKVDFSC